jgi:hypothetical protein
MGRGKPRWTEYLTWALIGLALVGISLTQTNGPVLRNDGFQYLSVADNLAKGEGNATSIIHFDEQHRPGTVPSPQTVFPPGYPVAVAGFIRLGLPLQKAGLCVSALAGILLVVAYLRAGALLGIGPWPLRFSAALLVVNSAFSLYASSILSESLFTLLALHALTLFLRAEMAGEGKGRRYVVLGSLVLGVNCWVRYAGYFFVAATLLYYGVRYVTRRHREALRTAALVSVCCFPFILANVLRNIAYTGDWRGGSTKEVLHPLADIFAQFAHSVGALLLNSRVPHDAFPGMKGLEIGVFLVVSVSTAALLAARRTEVVRQLRCPPMVLASFQISIYLCCLFYAGRTSVISFGDPRMLYPIFPMALLVFGKVLSDLPQWPAAGSRYRIGYALLVGGVVGYGALHLQAVLRPLPGPSYAAEIQEAVETPIGARNSLKEWVDNYVPPRQPILAADGQACSYFIRREAISLVSSEYSTSPWTEDRLRETASRYGADTLILFRDGEYDRDRALGSPFLTDLLHGNSPPWVVLAAENSKVIIYRLVVDN